ncbi:MAG: CopG family transcriptional regulator [Tenericutes bacterium]|nr:CopG family transcriptional regulator [Mycoplasmatota bacterium]
MIRTQIQLTEGQALTLKTIATEKHIPIAEIIRRGINSYLQTYGKITEKERRQRAVAAAGRFHSGKSNLSAKHDEYLVKAYEK